MVDFNRRDFAKASVIGAGAMAVNPLLAQGPRAAESAIPAGQARSGPVPLAPPDRQPPELEVPRPMKKAGYAVVGLGKLALDEVMPAFGEAKMSKATALVSGHPDKARQVAETFGIDRQRGLFDYQDFDRIRDSKDVDIVYIILPNSMHAEYTVRALEAGKHVLCEKPMAVSSAECDRMMAAARAADRKLMIAYRLHYEPYNMKVAELCRQRALGTVKSFVASNCQTTRAPNIRLSAALGGGPVGDTGIYCINAARYVFNEEPVSVTATAHRPADNPDFREVPESVAFTLRYASGAIAQCDTSFGTGESRRLRVHCADGFIDLDPAFSYRGLRMRVKRGNSDQGEVHDDHVVLKDVNQFAAEMDHFSDCVLNNKDVKTPGEMGRADMRIIEAVNEASRSGGSVQVRRG